MHSEKIEISDCVTTLLHAIDALDWAGVRGVFADTVTVDYTSLFGGEPANLAVDALITTWKGLVPGFDTTQHLIGPVVATIDGGSARAETHVRGYHRLGGAPGGDTWMVAGHYIFGLQKGSGRWQISAMTLVAYYQEGNLTLPIAARTRLEGGFTRPGHRAQ